MSAPVSYATADDARAYVERILRRPRPPTGRPAPAYLIAPSARINSSAWPKLRGAVEKLLPGCPLLEFGDVFGDSHPPAEARVPMIARRAGGAVVIPRAAHVGERVRYLIGYAARLEAAGLVAAGRPVLVLAPGGMLAWPDVRVRPGEPPTPEFAPLELDMPAQPVGAPVLPTVAASYRALGLPSPSPRRPPSARPPRQGQKPNPAVT